MIIFSLNLRGFGSPTKLASLKRLFLKIKSDIVFLQETLVHGDKAKNLFLQCLPHWCVVALDSLGLLGGLLTEWNPDVDEFHAFGTTSGIFLEGRVKHSKTPFKIFNCYAPYKEHEPFWKELFDSGFLHEDNIIIGGDLNFTLSANEVWGTTTMIDPLVDFIDNLLHRSRLIDLQPSVITPTWRNGRTGYNGISKRLDQFILDSKLVDGHQQFQMWVDFSSISNHQPICLQFGGPPQTSTTPFKFNCSWIKDPDFISLVHSTWTNLRDWCVVLPIFFMQRA
jgi:exonuclease III